MALSHEFLVAFLGDAGQFTQTSESVNRIPILVENVSTLFVPMPLGKTGIHTRT